MTKTDKTIIQAKSGNQKAFKKLFELHVDTVYRFLRKFEKNHDIVEDWTQRTFINAFNKIEQFNGLSKFSSWLISIALNEMKSDLRRKYNQTTILLEEYSIYESETDEIEEFVWQHDMEILFNELSDENKAIFILFEIEGYNHSEISDMLNISEAKSRTALCRTKKYLKTTIVSAGICYEK